jgi:hypothetical protein
VAVLAQEGHEVDGDDDDHGCLGGERGRVPAEHRLPEIHRNQQDSSPKLFVGQLLSRQRQLPAGSTS